MVNLLYEVVMIFEFLNSSLCTCNYFSLTVIKIHSR